MSKEFVIYTDESVKRGKFYSNFYGGALVRSSQLESVQNALNHKKRELHFYNELKWQRVTENYLSKYISIIDLFFDFIANDQIKIRIMCTQNANVPTNLNSYQLEHTYHLLYYQLFKHAFGLRYANSGDFPIYLRIYLDQMPDTKAKNAQFKAHLIGLEKSIDFKDAKIRLREDQIAEVNSENHVILQCLDIILGAMQFRLNDMHKAKPKGGNRRGKRTIAKEKLYKHILARIREIYPNFNIGISTGTHEVSDKWAHPYRHWIFIPKEFKRDKSQTKGSK